MARTNTKNAAEELMQLSALTASANALGGNANPELQAALTEAIKEILDNKRKNAENEEQVRKEQVEAIRIATAAKKAQQAACRHRKENNETALGGQRIGGFDTGHPVQLTLVCSHCNKNFHNPPLAGQEAAPVELIPPANVLGGQLT